jgi:adenosylcobinamide-GDP ribazoletransferase
MSSEYNWLRQLNLFFVAMGFFTRLPTPSWVITDENELKKSSRYFGLVGLLIGIICALVYWFTQQWLPTNVAVLLAMVAGVIVTGGFHEGGLADTADGFLGGKTVEDKLRIMKDSRLGSYGALVLTLALLLRWQLLVELALFSPWAAITGFIVAHTLSRVLASSLIFSVKYVSNPDAEVSKRLTHDQSLNDLLFLLASGIFVLFWLNGLAAFVLFISLWVLRFSLCKYFRTQIGGYTGDTLDAAQQVTEIMCYLIILAVGLS